MLIEILTIIQVILIATAIILILKDYNKETDKRTIILLIMNIIVAIIVFLL